MQKNIKYGIINPSEYCFMIINQKAFEIDLINSLENDSNSGKNQHVINRIKKRIEFIDQELKIIRKEEKKKVIENYKNNCLMLDFYEEESNNFIYYLVEYFNIDNVFSISVLWEHIKLLNSILESCNQEKKQLIFDKKKEIIYRFSLLKQCLELELTPFFEYEKRIDFQNEIISNQIQAIKDDMLIKNKEKLISMLGTSANIIALEKKEIALFKKLKLKSDCKIKIDEYLMAAEYFRDIVYYP